MKPEALASGLPAARRKISAPFQVLIPATLLTLCTAPSPAPAQLLAGSWTAFGGGLERLGAGPRAFGGCKLLEQSVVADETLALVLVAGAGHVKAALEGPLPSSLAKLFILSLPLSFQISLLQRDWSFAWPGQEDRAGLLEDRAGLLISDEPCRQGAVYQQKYLRHA